LFNRRQFRQLWAEGQKGHTRGEMRAGALTSKGGTRAYKTAVNVWMMVTGTNVQQLLTPIRQDGANWS
jgi:hypothetical protein